MNSFNWNLTPVPPVPVLEYLLSPVTKAVQEAGREMKGLSMAMMTSNRYTSNSCSRSYLLDCRPKTLMKSAVATSQIMPNLGLALTVGQV
jgi:hypothetical protein